MARRVALTYSASKPDKAEPYRAALSSVGLESVSNPGSLAEWDGLLVSGGADVAPFLYGQEPAPETQPADLERDELESHLIREALRQDIPLLCICRGLQILNVVQGGSLIQHIPSRSHEAGGRPKPADAHQVRLCAGTKLAAIVGGESFAVNSRHHQAADRLGEGLRLTAVAPDGIIEGLEIPTHRFAIAVQWHPEDRIGVSDADRRIFEAFAEAVNEV